MKAAICSFVLAVSLPSGLVAKQKPDFGVKESRQLVGTYADCVVEERASLAWRVVREYPDAATIMRRYPMIIIPRCATTKNGSGLEIRFAGETYLYDLSQSLFRKFIGNAPIDLPNAPALVHRPVEELDEAKLPKNKRMAENARQKHLASVGVAFLSRFGECVARKSSVDTFGLLKSSASSVEEKAAFAKLQPTLSNCLSQGTQLKFTMSSLRGAIALGYVRLADALRPDAFLVAKGREDA